MYEGKLAKWLIAVSWITDPSRASPLGFWNWVSLGGRILPYANLTAGEKAVFFLLCD